MVSPVTPTMMIGGGVTSRSTPVLGRQEEEGGDNHSNRGGREDEWVWGLAAADI